MMVGIHIDPDGSPDKTLLRYEKILEFNGIKYIRLNVNQPDFWRQVEKLDLFIFEWYWTSRQHQMAPTILSLVENEMNVKCFPNLKTWWTYDDKIREYYLLEPHSFPVIPTWIFWDEASALEWLESTELPVVFKLKGGAGSGNVVLVKTKSHAELLIHKMFGKGIASGCVPGILDLRINDLGYFKTIRRYLGDRLRSLQLKSVSPFEQEHKNYTLFQKYLSGNTFDVRITTVGNRTFGSIRYMRKNDFRASGSGRDGWEKKDVDLRCVEIGYRISKKLEFQSMAYDLLFDNENKPYISEISYTSPDWSVWMSPGYWDNNLEWHDGQLWPQYCVLMDLLNLPDLKQPAMNRQ